MCQYMLLCSSHSTMSLIRSYCSKNIQDYTLETDPHPKVQIPTHSQVACSGRESHRGSTRASHHLRIMIDGGAGLRGGRAVPRVLSLSVTPACPALCPWLHHSAPQGTHKSIGGALHSASHGTGGFGYSLPGCSP